MQILVEKHFIHLVAENKSKMIAACWAHRFQWVIDLVVFGNLQIKWTLKWFGDIWLKWVDLINFWVWIVDGGVYSDSEILMFECSVMVE